MKKNSLFLSITLLSLLVPTLSACGKSGDYIYLRVLNSEEYIYYEDKNDNMLRLFEDYCAEELDMKVKVIYETFDTNETMLNTLKTGKATYDLVCPSDYVIQKMISLDMIQPFNFSHLTNYVKHCPEYLRDVFRNITATDKEGTSHTIDEFAVGYMWGTLGILYNPTYKSFVNRGYSEEEVMEDMTDWNVLWDSKYKGTISIKDSMRDTYSVGIMRVYDEEFRALKDQHDQGLIDDQKYNQELTKIFNYCDKDTIKAVEQELLSLKNNIFGFEVDSGKEDINTGKIGVNIAWSGDAVYAMDLGDGYKVPTTLYYSIPETGGNIWFDGWVMPKSSKLNQDLAEEFVNFISRPDMAQLNMYGVGYTPFIGGVDILEYNKMTYDIRAYYLFEYDEEEGEFKVDDDGNYIRIPGRENLTWESPEVVAYAISEGCEPVDLNYMFTNTKGEGDFSPEEMIIYPEELGRQFSAQYPTSEEIKRLAVMQDFGENNKYVLDMWENVKTKSLPLWATILLILEIVLAVAFVLFHFVKKTIIKKQRKNRNKAA